MSDDHVDALTDKSARIVQAHRLLRAAKRKKAGEFLADGAQAVREAVAAHRMRPDIVRELYITAAGASRHTEIVRAAFDACITVTQVTDRAAHQLSDAVTPQGLTARCALPAPAALPAVISKAPRLIAVLVEPADPGNTGTVIRLADAAGADAVIVAGHGADPWGSKAVRGSAGSIFHIPVIRADDPPAVLRELHAGGLTTLATTGSAELELPQAAADGLLAQPTAWLFGNEAHGLPPELIEAATAVRVPIYGRAESLNLATAAAICLYASASAQRSDGDAGRSR